MTEQKKIAVSYEVLYELVRREKMKKELQPLEGQFAALLTDYLRKKENDYMEASHKQDFFSIGERDKLHIQLQNIRRLIKELHERREKKIVGMALNRSKLSQDLIDTSRLLDFERVFYDSLVSTMTGFKETGIIGVLLNKTPQVAPQTASAVITTPLKAPEVTPVLPTASMKVVRFLTFTPEFVGSSLEPYGPFEENQTATLPVDVAELLISQGSAAEMEGE